MKEIDFIPEWYKAGRERKRRYLRQYTLMAVLFTLMVGWGLIINGHIANVSAEVKEIQTSFEKGLSRSEQVAELASRIAQMKQKTTLLDKIESRTKVTAILGELSYLIGENIILSELSLENELISNSHTKDAFAPAAVVRSAESKNNNSDQVVPQSPSRCKVILKGIAARPADAASLIARLEQTNYFDQVLLVFSRPKKVKDNDVTEFGIRCFVADYQHVK